MTLEPTGRPAKSTTSISEKLQRETIRLTQVQDIAGCRLIVSDVADQARVVDSLKRLFENATVVDRREDPSHGYRAVHIIVKHGNKWVEIQVRTSLQQAWAELSEKLSDVIDPAIKYGRGDKSVIEPLLKLSEVVAQEEAREAQLAKIEGEISIMLSGRSLSPTQKQEVTDLQKKLVGLQKSHVSVREESLKILRGIKDRVRGGQK